MESWGTSEEFIAKELDKLFEKDFYLYPENFEALGIFAKLQTQWTVGANGKRIGLNYPAIESVLNTLLSISSPKRRAKLFGKIQLLESGALAGFAQQSKK